jgi:2'-5' RNA ligase
MVFRAFIAVNVEGRIMQPLAEALKGYHGNLKVVSLENLHLTLKFLGDTDEALVPDINAAIEDAVKDIHPFSIRIGGVGAFPNMNYIKVVWAGIGGGEPLVEMSRRLNESLKPMGFKKDKKGFSPHVTAARVKFLSDKKGFVDTLESFQDREFGEQMVDTIHLKKSVLTPSGPIYSIVSEVSLEQPK